MTHVPQVTTDGPVHHAGCVCGWTSVRPFNDIVNAARAASDHARMRQDTT